MGKKNQGLFYISNRLYRSFYSITFNFMGYRSTKMALVLVFQKTKTDRVIISTMYNCL
jgi:vacuolar-type H+-ATPase subunit C/Vma6